MHQRPALQATGALARVAARIFRRPGRSVSNTEAKASAAGSLIALETGRGEPVWTPRDYAAFAREGVMQNAIVYRCVRMIAEAAASVPLLLYERDEEIVEHPLLDLVGRPSPGQTGTDLMESFFGFLLVSGNAYIEAAALDGTLRELHALRPDRMKVIPGADGWPEAFEYSAGGRRVRIGGEAVPGVRSVLHMKLFHPANDHYGLSPIEAAASAIDLHNASSRWNKALLDNSARPSGALVYTSGQPMTAEQFERLKAELESSFQGTRNAGRPLLLEGGLDWKAMSLSPRDLDYMEARHAASREIALAIGVPPMLLGIPGDNTYANYAEANRAFWRQTVLPLVSRTSRALSMWLSPAYGGQLRFAPDLDQVEALSPERDALWSRLERTSFLTETEKRAAVGYGDASAKEGGDSAARPFLAKYREDQARDDQGRWVDESGGEDDGEDAVLIPVQDPLSGYPIDLRDEEARGGHTIAGHVNINPQQLTARVVDQAEATRAKGDDFRGFAVGSFTSLQAATRLVNSTFSEEQNKAMVDELLRGERFYAVLNSRFQRPTGYQAYLDSYHSQPYIQDTFGVRVIVLRDGSSPTGYRIQSAFPVR